MNNSDAITGKSKLYSDAARDAALKWLARGSAGRKGCKLSPMEELRYFDEPKTAVVSSGVVLVAPATQLVLPNAMRVGLIISVNQGNGIYGPGDVGVGGLNGGIFFHAGTALDAKYYSQAEHGNIVQMGWTCTRLGAGTDIMLGVVEILLKDWPSGGI